ncbi:MAG: Ig-like domain-containing protein [Deltaproteobacteria bacterium]|nr:Ig-like domain-containing protein [Deltaproteobacteria bacterium]
MSKSYLTYPHPKDWDKPIHHGDWTLKNATSECFECHTLETKEKELSPGCFKCHQQYPHPEGWKDLGNHGQVYLSRGRKECATTCHGSDLRGGISGVSCSTVECHSGYPHPLRWKEISGHGAMVLEIGSKSCGTANCHGVAFEGAPARRVPSCYNYECHSDYPHIDPEWTAVGDRSKHAKVFIEKMKRGESDACTKCHGDSYEREIGGKQCTTCHPSGVTHQVGWGSGAGHGQYFSGRFTSLSTDSNCRSCHGEPIAFESGHTRDALASQSDCYSCHAAYPHTAYRDTTSLIVDSWEPVETKVCGERSPFGNYQAHANYVSGSPLINPVGMTCGGTTLGSCHFDGNRAYNHFVTPPGFACSYCHKLDLPSAPDLPPCDGPPPSSIQIDGPPRVVSVTPNDGATEIDPTIGGIVLQFNEAMERGSVERPGTFILKPVGSAVSVTTSVICSEDWCRTATVQPTAALVRGTVYEFRVTTQAKDWGGQSLAGDFVSSFTTIAPDSTPPQIISVSPADGAVLDCATNAMSVRFDEKLDWRSVSGAMSVRSTSSGSDISGCRTSCGVRENCSWISLSCGALLPGNKTYTVKVRTLLTDLAGNHLATEKSWRFTIRPYDPSCDEW